MQSVRDLYTLLFWWEAVPDVLTSLSVLNQVDFVCHLQARNSMMRYLMHFESQSNPEAVRFSHVWLAVTLIFHMVWHIDMNQRVSWLAVYKIAA